MTMADLIKAGATRDAMATRLASLCWRPDVECFYFGCMDSPGHFFHGPSRSREELWALQGRLSTLFHGLDGKLCWNSPKSDSDRYRPRDETEGWAFVTHRGGWTALAFWDRSVDRRGACNSVFIVCGTLSFDQVVRVARHRWPKIWSRFTFEVVQVDEHGVLVWQERTGVNDFKGCGVT